jgi:hypothetical protein
VTKVYAKASPFNQTSRATAGERAIAETASWLTSAAAALGAAEDQKLDLYRRH